MTEYVTIEHRALREVCTDPQRRRYYGVWAKSEMQWSGWEALDSFCPPDRAEARLEFWRDLNAYAVRERGEGARKEFRVMGTKSE
jgi:hypothetical protein